jgi:hypothetical protein
VKVLEEIGPLELSLEQKENLRIFVEKAARGFIESKIPLNKVRMLNINVEIDKNMSVTVTVDVELAPLSSVKDCDVEQLVNEATRGALEAADIRFGEISCKSET